MKREIWWEKHRPTTLDDFEGQEGLVAEITPILAGEAPMQHFIFHSPEPGTGKTTLAYIIADTLGYQLHKFNASSKRQRGIEFVEEDVAPLSRIGQWETIFFLDEADRLTVQAQDALKGVIEDACGFFILTCNDLSKVSPWLQSRAQVRTFTPHSKELVERRLAKIAALEGAEIGSHPIKVIAAKHGGDLRNSIGALQTAAHLKPDDRRKFIAKLEAADFSPKRVIQLAMKEKAIRMAIAELVQGEAISNQMIRARVRGVFLWAINANSHDYDTDPSAFRYCRRVIDCAIEAERDLINGCDPEMVAWNFCKVLGDRAQVE